MIKKNLGSLYVQGTRIKEINNTDKFTLLVCHITEEWMSNKSLECHERDLEKAKSMYSTEN